MQGRSLEQMSPAIRRFLEEQQRPSAQQAMIAELRRPVPRSASARCAARSVNIDADDPSEGPAKAPVTIVEFSDFQCPFCLRVRRR